MSAGRETSEVRLPLTPAVFHIFLALADGERHGYSIMQEIAEQTEGRLRIGPTTLYRSIKHMLEDGLIEETEERPDPALDDERRRYYRLTAAGLQVARAEVRRQAQAVEVARTKPLLGDAALKPMFGGQNKMVRKGKSSSLQSGIVRLTIWLYRWLLGLGPEAFRHEYEDEMLRTLRQYCQDEYARHGSMGVLGLWPSLLPRAIIDMLVERLSTKGEGIIMRRATILTYCAFVLFTLGYLTLMRVSDPVAPFNAVAQAHPLVGIAYHTIVGSMDLAVLAMLLGGALVSYSIITSARSGSHHLIKLFLPTKRHLGMLVVGTFVVAFCLALYIVIFGCIAGMTPHIAGLPLWIALPIVLASIFIGSAQVAFVILLISAMIALAVARSVINLRTFRIVRICMVATLLGMGLSFAATLCWIGALWTSAPQFTMSDAGLGTGNLTWVILALGAMLLALCVIIAALRQSTRVHMSVTVPN